MSRVLAANLRALMDARGINQPELARLTANRVTQKTVSNILLERNVTQASVEAIADALGVSYWRMYADPTDESVRIIDAYLAASQDGRDLIKKVIEREAAFGNRS